MFGREKKAISMTAIIAALVLGAASAGVAPGAFALQRAATINDGSGALTIRLAEGKISGKFDDLPLFEVLDEIGRQAGFEYQGDDELLDQPVSGNFEERPLIDALKWMLDPFNYVVIFGENGQIERLHIISLISLRDELARGVPAPARVPPKTSSLDPPLDYERETPTGLELLTMGERRLFVTADEELGPPLELLEYFEPWQELGSEDTGPQVDPDTAVKELPEFEPVISETGPTFDMLETDEALRNAAGLPIDPFMGVQTLPEFEPVISETGPTLDMLETYAIFPPPPR